MLPRNNRVRNVKIGNKQSAFVHIAFGHIFRLILSLVCTAYSCGDISNSLQLGNCLCGHKSVLCQYLLLESDHRPTER